VTEFFRPQPPLWACELTSTHAIIAGVNSRRNRIQAKFAAQLPAGKDLAVAKPLVERVLSDIGFKGSEIAVVVPDGAARIAFVTAESLSKNPEEQLSFIRWKLKKSLPFDVDTAQVAYRILGRHRAGSGIDLLVALSPRSVIQEYERLFEDLDIHAGLILPSTLAALNLFNPPEDDALFVKIAPDSITTTVFQKRRVQFYRRVSGLPLYDAVYPTVLYYQDKLGGSALERLYVCGYDPDLKPALDDLQTKLGLAAERVEPAVVEDIYKPALGAVHGRV
jgi:type IV pilus assembly protein PilM